MSVRKRQWTTPKGESKSAWVVDYMDQGGKRRQKSFRLKKDADAFALTAGTEVREGRHVADSASATIKEAAKLWIAARERAGRERSTIAQYKNHIDLHINPLIGETRLTALTAPALRQFEEDLLDGGRSAAMVRKVFVSLGSLLADAQDRGLVGRNVVHDMRGRRGTSDRRAEKRAKGRLKVGVDIPAPDEIKAIVAAVKGRWRPVILTAIFTGMRASELRGLPWKDVDLDKRVIHVRQRADRFAKIGRPKSDAGERDIPIPPVIVNTLKEWKLACPKGEHGLVFPNSRGNIEGHSHLVHFGLLPPQVAGGVTVPGKNKKGEPVEVAKYTGMHALRHFYASWCINRKEDGGLGLPPKVVQERLGHSSITMTMDTYGHLFPRGDDAEELAAAEKSLLG